MVDSGPVKINTADAKVDMVLAQPIIDQLGRIIMTEGSHLTAIHLKRFDRWGVTEIVVLQGDEPDDPTEEDDSNEEEPRAMQVDEEYMHKMAVIFNQRFESVSDKPIMEALKKIAFKCVIMAGRNGIPGIREKSSRGH